MSMQTWKDEFCTKTDLEKFIGLRPENMEKHGIKFSFWSRFTLTDGDVSNNFKLNNKTCMLCSIHLENSDDINCPGCPIDTLTGRSCGIDIEDAEGNEIEHPFSAIEKGDPEPMIALLTKIRDTWGLPLRSEEVNS